jgi:hypothetical protein
MNATCSVEGCNTEVRHRGLCLKHYTRVRRTGSTAKRPPLTDEDYVRRFWSRVDRRGPDECWLWLGTLCSTGYGQFWFPPRKPLAHRLAYELTFGPIPDGLTLDHLCYVRNCVNPAHLEPVPLEVNYRRAVEKGRLANGGDHNRQKTHCAQGHPFDEANTYLRPGGGRGCRACNRAAAARSKSKGDFA